MGSWIDLFFLKNCLDYMIRLADFSNLWILVYFVPPLREKLKQKHAIGVIHKSLSIINNST